MRIELRLAFVAAAAAAVLLAADAGSQSSSPAAKSAPPTFETAVKPVFTKTCFACHNDRMASGGLDIGQYLAPSSISAHRDQWERILLKIRNGEMPPKGIPRPAESQVTALIDFVRNEIENADRNLKPDPGRVTARRLNRAEYSNTIRDLLGVDFRADKDFPTDDSGYGFDNIGDVLTISPVLMEKYVNAAERIAARAIGADPLPKPFEVEYHSKDKRIRRPNASSIEATHQIDFDGEYVVRFGMPGERSADAKPVKLGFWMDGKLLHTMDVETKPSKLVYFNPYSEAEVKLNLPEGDHVFRAGFIDDDYIKTLDEKDLYKDKKNKWLNSIKFLGPYATAAERPSRKKILTCDPKTGAACVQKIVSTLARRAYRRPVTPAEVNSLLRFVKLAQSEGGSVEQGIQLAIQAMLVSPHFLFRIERDPEVLNPDKTHNLSDFELASRLSYFLWSSMPDDELLDLAASRKLHEPAVLDGQVKRMLSDPRLSAFSDNFAGQWLETRNLDSVKPDPGKFPEWGPDLRDAMKAETRLFFESILKENKPLTEFLTAKYTFVNDRLAQHYGIPGVTGPEFRRIELTSDQRGGILSQASVLTVSSYPTRTSPVIRGKYVLQNILGTPPPPPPPDVPALDEAAVGSKGSMRQQLEQHRSNAICASCHSKMDVLGFGLENYNAIGKWRTVDGKFPIDSSGTLPTGKSFNTPAEMRELLKADLPEFARCLTEKMLTYALGRGLEPYDKRTVSGIVKDLQQSDYKFQTLIYDIVKSMPFQQRRGEAAKPTKAVTKEVAQR